MLSCICESALSPLHAAHRRRLCHRFPTSYATVEAFAGNDRPGPALSFASCGRMHPDLCPTSNSATALGLSPIRTSLPNGLRGRLSWSPSLPQIVAFLSTALTLMTEQTAASGGSLVLTGKQVSFSRFVAPPAVFVPVWRSRSWRGVRGAGHVPGRRCVQLFEPSRVTSEIQPVSRLFTCSCSGDTRAVASRRVSRVSSFTMPFSACDDLYVVFVASGRPMLVHRRPAVRIRRFWCFPRSHVASSEAVSAVGGLHRVKEHVRFYQFASRYIDVPVLERRCVVFCQCRYSFE